MEISPQNILIIKPSSLGDIAQTLPVAKVLKTHFPNVEISWLVNKEYVELLRLFPFIDKIMPFNRSGWRNIRYLRRTVKEFVKCIKDIRAQRFSMVIDLQGLFRSGFVTALSKASLKVGFGNAREYASIFYNKRIYPGPDKINAQERYLSIVEEIYGIRQWAGLSNEVNIPGKIEDWAEKVWGAYDKVRIVLNPGGRWDTKRWPVYKYAGLINELNNKYKAKILLIGDKNDCTTAIDMLNRIDSPVEDLIGKTTLTGLVAILNKCNILITNDSGPMHIADYLGKPVVAIFGPTDPNKTGPLGQKNKILRANIPCSPCFRRRCSNLKCMEGISVKDIINAVEDLLQNPKVLV